MLSLQLVERENSSLFRGQKTCERVAAVIIRVSVYYSIRRHVYLIRARSRGRTQSATVLARA